MVLLEQEIRHDIIDDMVWSFSRLNGFYTCKRAWYYTYIMKRSERENFFSQYGTFAHSVFEKYNKGELEIYELASYYNDNYYSNVTEEAPPNKYVDLNESYFNKGYDYFVNIKDNPDEEIIGAEVKFEFTIDVMDKPRKFIGYIDKVSRDKNGFVVTDYKSKGKFKNKEELHDYTRQLYIYAIALKEMYGEYPYKLVFEQFKENITQEICFNEKDLEETYDWIRNTIRLIYDEIDFPKTQNDFFCSYLCSARDTCITDTI